MIYAIIDKTNLQVLEVKKIQYEKKMDLYFFIDKLKENIKDKNYILLYEEE